MTGTLVGTGSLLRLVLRRDRVRLPVWMAAISAVVAGSGVAVAQAYPTAAERAGYAATMGESPATIALAGPPYGLDTLGGILVYETALTAFLGVALMALFAVVRHTRAEEDDGRTELLRSTVVGVHAHLAAALVVTVAASLLLGVLVAGGLIVAGAAVGGSALFGAATAALGAVMAGVTAVCAQVMPGARAAAGTAGAILAVAFVLRAIGDVQESALSWASPIGWSQQVRAFDDERWWPLAISLVVAVVATVVAAALAVRRDVGAGLVAPRPGPARAPRGLRSAWGVQWRLQRATIGWWVFGVGLVGVTFGSLSREVAEMVEQNPTFAEYFGADAAIGLQEAFLASALSISALIAAAFAVSSGLRTRSEETSGRLEMVLAAGATRRTWAAASVVVTALGSVVVVLAAGLGLGVAYGAVTGDYGVVLELAASALVQVPAVWVLAGVAFAVLGLAPRAGALAWAAAAGCLVVGWLGAAIAFPRVVVELSPFTHVPAMPAESFSATPVVLLVLVAAALTAAGVAGFTRRDVG
ncbi:MAG: ABC transporter permease [Nocardioides sp.]|nr:ABC transporter permease [Nocardioides sp.]